jgi:hypothetical protein
MLLGSTMGTWVTKAITAAMPSLFEAYAAVELPVDCVCGRADGRDL